MKKPEKDPKRIKASIKRGLKRSNRLKATQKAKPIKKEQERLRKLALEKSFQDHLSRLRGE